MNLADGLIFALLALADVALMIYLRRTRSRRARKQRMARCLALAIQRENAAQPFMEATKRWPMRRAS